MITKENRKWWAIAALDLSLLAVGLDATVLNLALPTLANLLHASENQLQWFVAAYSLTLAAGLLPAGLLGDRFGRKKVLLLALVLFGAGSIACAYAPSSGALIAARAVLGFGAACLITLSLSVLTVLFSETERPRAVGIWAAANFLALPIGPLLGGWLLSHYWWGWVFLINVPVVLLALAAVVVLLPESRSSERIGLDLPGILISSSGLAAMTYGLIQAGQNGWGSLSALAPLAGGLLAVAVFVGWEKLLERRPGGRPMVDLSLFSLPGFTWGTVLAAMGGFAMFGVLFAIPQYFQAVRGIDAQGSGARLIPLILGLMVGAFIADRLAARLGTKFTVALGFIILAGGMAAGSITSVNTGDAYTAFWTTLCGLGMGFALATAASAALSQLSAERSGVGSALMQTVQKIGVPFGVAILGSVLNSVYQAHISSAGVPPSTSEVIKKSVFAGVAVAQKLGSAGLLNSVHSAFISGMDTMLLICSGIAVAGILLAIIALPGKPVETKQIPEKRVESERV